MSNIKTPNLCLRCWYYVQGRSVKTPDVWCKITRSK